MATPHAIIVPRSHKRLAPDVVSRFATQHGLPHADVVLDQASQLGSSLGYKALPTTLFYDGQGRLAAVRAGELSAATLADNLGVSSFSVQ